MGLFGGPGPVLGGSAGGQDYSLASMLNRATQKQAGRVPGTGLLEITMIFSLRCQSLRCQSQYMVSTD